MDQQNKNVSCKNLKASAINMKELWGTDLDYSDNETENTEELSISSSKQFYEERFQIDRTKLRRMIQTSINVNWKNEADFYFDNIMKSTETNIEWPRSYKSDTKCKQHPFVRITGSRLEDVTWAKGLVLTGLEVNNSFLRLKMAISNTDHLFILGRNNNNVNRIMDETESHIQFPDSNQMKKENQVLVYGTLDGLDSARVLLRSSAPLVMSFELPMNQTIPFVEKIGAYFKVQVLFSVSSKPKTSLVLIRGSVRRAEKIKEATRSLLKSAFGNKIANSTTVSAQLEIPIQYQESVKGENCTNIKEIMEETNTKIFFPEFPFRGYRKSQVTIKGTMDEVCVAREKLVASLPIELTFEIPDESRSATEIMNLGKKAGLNITISQKERDCKTSVTIKGAERLIDTIYEIHRCVLKLKNPKSLVHFHQAEADFVSMEYGSNETWLPNEQFATVSSPDSGHASIVSFQDGSQQSPWIVVDNQGPYNLTAQPDILGTSQGQCIPSYNDCNPILNERQHLDILHFNQENPEHSNEQSYGNNDWIIQYNNIQQIQHQEEKLFHLTVPCEISPAESEVSLSFLSMNSPLIVGSEQSVAERLICTGWGNFF